MTLVYILFATFAGGVLSVLAAATLSLTILKGMAHKLVSFSVGLLLAIAFLDLLPEASETLNGRAVGATLLAGILIFFALEKVALWRHDHHEDSEHVCHAHHTSGPLIVVGDGLHNFVDGVLIAASFLQSDALGWATTVAVVSHEVPHEIGAFMVLLSAGYGRARALWLNIVSSLASILGGILGWFALSGTHGVIPYILALAAASFIYIAVADLVPTLHKERKPADFVIQFALLGVGVGVVLLNSHGH